MESETKSMQKTKSILIGLAGADMVVKLFPYHVCFNQKAAWTAR